MSPISSSTGSPSRRAISSTYAPAYPSSGGSCPRLRLDRLAEALDLSADVVVVVLALDVMPGELEQASDRVAVRGVPRGADGQRPGRVRGHHLDLDALLDVRRSRPVARPGLEDLCERLPEPLRVEPEVDEAGAGHFRPLDRSDTGRMPGELLRELP
jgi:hypothetical protein